MATDKTSTDERVVKVPFPIGLIRRMDEAIVAELGGFRTRAELMREAVENLLTELEYPDAPDEPVSSGPVPSGTDLAIAPADEAPERFGNLDDVLASVPTWERDELALADLAATGLVVPKKQPALLHHGAAAVRQEPLLGLHNRDYVSIWALHRLARYTEDHPISFDDYLRQVTKAAWYFGAQLQALERQDNGRKLTVLFPTNAAKRPSAERGFQSFAVGSLARRSDDGSVPASGPLFAWRAIEILADGGSSTALTEHGWRLIQHLDGLSLDLPHSPELARRFLTYLAEHAPSDRWGFDHLLRVVADGPDREGLVESFAAEHPAWTASTASSVAQGYIARSREWGLVEQRLVEGRYWLTDEGRRLADQLDQSTD